MVHLLKIGEPVYQSVFCQEEVTQDNSASHENLIKYMQRVPGNQQGAGQYARSSNTKNWPLPQGTRRENRILERVPWQEGWPWVRTYIANLSAREQDTTYSVHSLLPYILPSLYFPLAEPFWKPAGKGTCYGQSRRVTIVSRTRVVRRAGKEGIWKDKHKKHLWGAVKQSSLDSDSLNPCLLLPTWANSTEPFWCWFPHLIKTTAPILKKCHRQN